MKVLIVEDENQTAQRLVKLLGRYDAAIEILGCFPSVSKTLAYFSDPDTINPDLIFLDIHLEDDLGFIILEKLDLTLPVIFTTAYSEYSLKAFKNFSIDYLLKPIDFDELCQALDKYKRIASLQVTTNQPVFLEPEPASETGFKERFMVSIGPNILSIPASQIAYFSYEQKAAFLTTFDNKHYAVDYSLDRLIQLLDPKQFFRVNRSFIVSVSCISSVFSYSPGKLKVEINPVSKTEIFVSIDRISSFKLWLGK